MTEHGVIERILAQRPPRPVTLAPLRVEVGDDAAVMADGTAITIDTLIEGIHFLPTANPRDLGFKALAVSVSDLLAMGARPTHAVLSLSLPSMSAERLHTAEGLDPSDWLDAFASGLAEACEAFGVHLVGGDTTGSSGPRVISLTLCGDAPSSPWRRSDARVGDDLFTTGQLGEAGAGWMLPDPWPGAKKAIARPLPPKAFVEALVEHNIVRGAMDLSDGLAADLPRLCAASSVSAIIDPLTLPGSTEVIAHPQRLALQTCGGEDYQLLFTADPCSAAALTRIAEATGVRLTRIGQIVKDGGARLAGMPWPPPSFSHFEGAA